jgi:FMN phosphatase YigB (HAD superfamily)
VVKKIISFDLDGTIVDAVYGNMVWLEGIPEKYGQRHGLSLEEAKALVKSHYDSVGEVHLLWYNIDYWLERFELSISVSALLDYYSGYIKLLPNVAPVLEKLSTRYRLVIASNAARIFVDQELRHTGIERYFCCTISATSDFQMVKKEEGFFRRLCSVLDVAPSDMVHIGDHAVFDVEVPRRVGIECYHYAPAHAKNGGVIHDFQELLSFL